MPSGLFTFLPKGSRPQLNVRAKIDKMIRKVQRFYAEQIESHRFDRRIYYCLKQIKKARHRYILWTGKLTVENYLENTLTKVGARDRLNSILTFRETYTLLLLNSAAKGLMRMYAGLGRVNLVWNGGELWQAKGLDWRAFRPLKIVLIGTPPHMNSDTPLA